MPLKIKQNDCLLSRSWRYYTAADALAPFGVSANSQFFRPTVKGRMAFSATYLHIRITQRAVYSRLLYRKEKLGDDRYHSWCWFQRDYLQHCGNSKSKQFKTIWLFRISFDRDSETFRWKWPDFLWRPASVVEKTSS